MNEMIPKTKQISEMSFSLLSPEQIKKFSVAKIVTPELYDVDGHPVDGGLMDLRLGAIDPGVRCRTCGGRIGECLGHPGSIDLARPVMHLKYIPIIEIILNCFCNNCGKLMVADRDLVKYSQNKRAKRAKDTRKCPHCSTIKEKIKLEKPTSFFKGRTRMTPIEIRSVLEKIHDRELQKIGIFTKSFRPEWAVLTILLVPSVTVRPSIILETGDRSEDDLTHKLSDIVRANQRLWENLNAGAPEVIIDDLWELLQFHVTTFFDNSVARIPPARHRSGQPLKTITERIKGKGGRIRKNLSGKRVNYSARTVISPDPDMKINEVGIPIEIAKIVTVAEIVNDINIEMMKEMITRGDDYPGARYVIRPDGKKKKITPELKEEIVNEIEPGYIVERHMRDGDVVLFNRHPSLHRVSLMAHFVKILPGKTFRLHPAAAAPYNADYDGDEMNIHSPQTEEARAEARILLDVKKNLVSPKNSTNLIGCISDAITGNYLISQTEFSKPDAEQLLYQIGVVSAFNKKTIAGKEFYSDLFPKIDFKNDSIKISKGELISGILDKNVLGEEDGELIRDIIKQKGDEEAFLTIRKTFDIGRKYLSQRGISISLQDFDLSQKSIDFSNDVMRKAELKTQEILDAHKKGTLEKIPGKTDEESKETHILKVLNEVRTKIGEMVKRDFPEYNPITHMIRSGGAGSILNITQIACCVGQQDLEGKRIDIGYNQRTLSFFKKADFSPKARGFISSPLIKGFRPDEFFFGAMTGRSTLMDTGLRTPKSGYLYRRLANALQDLRVEYDKTVRDSSNNIIQFKYGDDGVDVSQLPQSGQINPGEAIGIVTAQSFGESSTQMLLRTFHFAGVTEMQVTQGLPRLIELFDARKKPSSPKMEVYLDKEYNNEKNAKDIAEKIKEIKLEDMSSEIELNFSDKKIEIRLNDEFLKRVKISPEKINERLKDLGYKSRYRDEKIFVNVDEPSFKELFKIKEKLKETIIRGIKGVGQILIVKRGKDFVVVTLGTNLKKVLQIKGVDATRTISNDLHEVAGVFGIEAARSLIINEMYEVLSNQGLDIDIRHLKLVADAMTNTGEVKGVTRIGIISQKSSILARAAFETPVRLFVNATIKGLKDRLLSVVENIIVNQLVPIGTGLPGLLVKIIGPLSTDKQKKVKKEVVKSVEE